MKTVHLFGEKKFDVNDSQGEKVEQAFMSGVRVGFKMGGVTFTTSSINYIENTPKKATWGGYDLSKDKNGDWYFRRDGMKIYLEGHNVAEIKYIESTDAKRLN